MLLTPRATQAYFGQIARLEAAEDFRLALAARIPHLTAEGQKKELENYSGRARGEDPASKVRIIKPNEVGDFFRSL